MNYEQRLIGYIKEHKSLLLDLQMVRELNLPDCYIAAGYIRNMVWDRLHGYPTRDVHSDIDVVYFDPHDTSEARDHETEYELRTRTGNNKWSVKNQARMHEKNGDPTYRNTMHAIEHWPETATAIGARLDRNDRIQIIAPYGLKDVFGMVVRRSPLFQDRVYYLNRVKAKNWTEFWPRLQIVED